jgi:hypothetical protein
MHRTMFLRVTSAANVVAENQQAMPSLAMYLIGLFRGKEQPWEALPDSLRV